jgi:type IV secretion system protein VirB10
MTKEEFIAQQMLQTQNIQNQLYGNGGAMPRMNGTTNMTGDKDSFFNAASNASGRGEYLSNTCLWDGTIISGALITAINTDNPGVVIARVTENVYSSYDHSYLLIPEGSLLFATYNSSISYGQKQVQVAWNLLIRPDNYRVQLGNMNGVNAQGASGYTGSVSNHPFETLKALGMVAVFSIIQTEITNDINSQNNEYLKNSMTDVYSEASKLGNKILDKALDIKPTIKIKEGTEIKLITNVPLELPPVEVNQVTQKYVRTR